MENSEVKEKYGISKKMGIGIVLQTALVVAALAISVVALIRSREIHRIMIFVGQIGACIAVIEMGLFRFKVRDWRGFRLMLNAYALLEALRAALLNTSGINIAVAGGSRFLLAVLACCCVLLAERLGKKHCEKIAYAMVVMESALYLLFIFGFPGMMYGRLNRFVPLAGVFIAGSVCLFLKAKLEQMEGVEIPAETDGTPRKKWQSIVIVCLCAAIVLTALYGVSVGHQKTIEEENTKKEAVLSGKDALSLWTESAEARKELTSYMNAITEKGGADYIPVEDRIAVFDFDGTLFCETDPNYFDYTLLVYRVTEDPGYKDKASDFEKEVAQKIITLNETGEAAKGLEVDHGKAVASAFSGMTMDEFYDYVAEFKKLPMPGYEGMTRGGGFYEPMLQVVKYLQDNDFTVFIISGTDRFIVRGIVDGSPLDIPAEHIIGSDETVVASDQGDTDGLSYVFDEDDELILGGQFLIKNLKMNKVSVIEQEIGKQPVLSFGNSTGDSSMAEYTTSNNPYRSLAFMLCCDDTERENGNVEKADKMVSLCGENGWIPVSMKNDWTRIYGEGVVKK